MIAVVIAGIVYIVLAVFVAAVAAVALAQKLPRNRWLGLHTDASLRDEPTFRAANRIAAPSQLGAAVILLLGGIGGLLLAGAAGVFVVIAAPVIAVVLIGSGAALGQNVAAALATAPEADDTGACGHSCGACSLQDSCEFSVTRSAAPAGPADPAGPAGSRPQPRG